MIEKLCSDCLKLLSYEHFYTESRSSDGFKKRCKKCETLRRNRIKVLKMSPIERGEFIKIKYWENIHSINGLSLIFECSESYIIYYLQSFGIYLKESKPCGNCNELKIISEFGVGQLNWSGWCKSCVLNYNRSYYKENKEEIKEKTSNYYYENYEKSIEYRRQYIIDNKESLAIRHKKYYRDHIEERSEYNKNYYQENSEQIKDNVNRWLNNNRGLANSFKSKYRAKKLNATPSWANLDKIKAFYQEAQRLTKETGILHHVDHIIPLQGKNVCGLHVEYNLQILTYEENNQKSNSFKPIILSEIKK